MSPHRTGTNIADARRLIIKIGSALLVDENRGSVHRAWLDALAADVAEARARGQEVILVSSGAIAVGRKHLKLGAGLKLGEKQAAAALGQVRLAHAYQEALGAYDLEVAQILLTLDDSENRRRYINARNTIEVLLRLGAVPLINENDTVATDEIRFGDNDRLAARVAEMTGADTLVLLSDIDGLYTADPGSVANAEFVPLVEDVTADIEAMAGTARPGYGSGGMVTKLAAAKICLASGCRMVLALGKELRPLKRLLDGGRATWFLAASSPKAARKRWIAGSLKTEGVLTVDDGALKALANGRSLLPIGVAGVDGDFARGAAVSVHDKAGKEIARGLIEYPADDARLIMGHKSGEIEQRLGYRGADEMIHRDDLVVLE